LRDLKLTMNRQRRRNNRAEGVYVSSSRRARSLWDDTRKPDATKITFLRAILYELQPIRFSTIQTKFQFNSTSIQKTFQTTIKPKLGHFIQITLPLIVQTCWHFIKTRSMKEWIYISIFGLYWKMITYVHELLDAGPIVVIITILVLIFTIGLGDRSAMQGANGEGDDNYVSAYSVFNRGFQSILGSIDAENLVNQHVGGGMAGAFVAAGGIGRDDHDNHNRNDEMVNDDHDQAHAQAHANNGQQNNNDQHAQQQQQQNQNRNTSRKSGKKSRRKRNIEQKREQRRQMELQREAAAAMGFGGGNGIRGEEGPDDIMAMNRLIEEQAELAEINNVGQD
jgi:hypothetical protein